MKVIWPISELRQGDNLPGSIMVFSSLLSRNGFQSEVLPDDPATIISALKPGEPAVLAFSCATTTVARYLEVNRRVKAKRTVFSLFGGVHPTLFPEMIEEEGVDALCVGEGEGALIELLTNLSEGRSIDGIQNLHIKREGQVYKNPIRPLIEDLDSLPVPDHKIFERAIPRTLWRTLVVTGRGCPYRCSYCSNDPYRAIYRGKGRWLRRRSVDHVMEELGALKASRRYEFIRFVDDIFTLDQAWIEEFSEKYRRIGIPFGCLTRANYVKEPIVRCLAEAGCWSMSLGVEAANDRIRNEIFNREMTKDEIIRACEIIKKSGIKLGALNIVAAPDSTLKEDLETLEFNMRLKPDYCSVLMLQPYRGTAIYEFVRKRDLLEDDPINLSWAGVNLRSFIKYPTRIEKLKVENLHKLFALVVHWPWLKRFLGPLVRLPLTRFYYWFYRRMCNYQEYFIATPLKIGLRNIVKRSRLYSWIRG